MSDEKIETVEGALAFHDESAAHKAIKAIAAHVAGLAADCGKSGHQYLVKLVDEILDGPAPVAEPVVVEEPKAETVVSEPPLDAIVDVPEEPAS
jgi:hypothetical protein